MRKDIKPDSNCLDIGCHKGELLESILKLSPEGKHFGFEPIPSFYNDLQSNFGSKATILPYALSNEEGVSGFNFVKNAPAYSGLQKRKYATDNPEIEEIEVEQKKLDDVIPSDLKIDFVKIDVEGGEFAVLKGGKATFQRNKPVIIFECGIGASDYYGTDPSQLFKFVQEELGMKLSLLRNYLDNKSEMTESDFVAEYNRNKEYYFVAHP